MIGASWISRRGLLQGTAASLVLSSAFAAHAAGEEPIPYTAGTEHPKHKALAHACDCHFHIYNARFPAAPNASLKPPDALASDYLRLRQRLGIERGVIVTPSTYGTDNSCTLDAMAQLGDTVRGVAVVDTAVTDAELKRLNDRGVRGIRFNIARTGATTVDMIDPLARRIADLGWHVQIHMAADGIAENAALLGRLPVPVVFDHLGRIPQPDGMKHPAFALIKRLLGEGRAWVKISSLYQDTKIGPPSYSDVGQVARAYIEAAPERVLWGSDWPHPSKGAYGTPDDALLFDLAAEWAGADETWRRILVGNPETLYGFPKTA